MMSVADRLQSLGIVLPTPPAALASYVPVVRTGTVLFVSGQAPIVDGLPTFRGKLGRDIDVARGAEAARLAALNAVSALLHEWNDLDRLSRVVKLTGYVNSTADFDQHHVVANGASDLLVEVFGSRGRHARAAVGMNSLPFDIPVEIEIIVEETS